MPLRPLPDAEPPDPGPLGASLDRLVRHLGGPSASAISTLFSAWDDIVGRPLCQHTWPLALDGGELVVGVDDAAWASQLRFLERELRGQVNDRLGPAAVTSVVFRVRPGGPADEGADLR